MKLRLSPRHSLVIILFVALMVRSYANPVYEVVLKPMDYGYIIHVEYVPRPQYQHKSTTASEIAKELILRKIYGEDIDESLLTFLLKCRRNGYFSSTPAGKDVDIESTFYSAWLFKMLNIDFSLDSKLFEDILCKSTLFKDAFYSARILELIGYDIGRECFRGWDLGYAVAWVKGSDNPSVEATRLFLLMFRDGEKTEWLRNRGVVIPCGEAYFYKRLDYGEWYNIELLITRRPIFVNASVYPKIIVNEKPRLEYVRCIMWPSLELNYTFEWMLVNNSVVSTIKCGYRILRFEHLVSRKEYATIKIVQNTGRLYLSTSYRPPYTLKINVAGIEYKWIVKGFDFNVSIDLPAYGSLKIKCVIVGKDSILIGEKTVFLETSYERRLLDYGFIILPLFSSLIGILGSRRSIRLRGTLLAVQTVPFAPLFFILDLNPLIITLSYGVFILLTTYVFDRQAFNRAVSHTIVLISLSATSMVIGNPLILLLGGFGATIFLVSAILYPSEIDKTERFYKSTMLLYSLGTLAMTILNNVATQIANLLYVPESGFIQAVKTQTLFISNLFSLTPVIAPIYHLTRLIHTYERARDVKEILKRIMFFNL